MRIVWFGGTTTRVHIGGRILVFDAEAAPAGIDPIELLGGADTTVPLLSPGALPAVDPTGRRRARTVLEAEGATGFTVGRVGEAGVLVDAADEPALLLVAGRGAAYGRWADGAAVVIFGSDDAAAEGLRLLERARPRVIALAIAEPEVETVFGALAGAVEGIGLIALAAGYAVEV